MDFDYAIHSDFLIYWTGKHLDEKDGDGNPNWCKPGENKSKTTKSETKAYIKRLHDILKFGLWMTEQDDGNTLSIPITPKTCFTELKLSESRKHARQYGRLGIGVKRLFIYERLGRPLVYYLPKTLNNDIFLKDCFQNLKDKNLLNFFKPMNSSLTLNYDLYNESEWRIIYFEKLLSERLILDPRDPINTKEYRYFASLTTNEREKLKYLIPFNGWFAMIIYPSLAVKNEAQEYIREPNRENGQTEYKLNGIQKEIARIKEDKIEHGNKPIELDLDACRNF